MAQFQIGEPMSVYPAHFIDQRCFNIKCAYTGFNNIKRNRGKRVFFHLLTNHFFI